MIRANYKLSLQSREELEQFLRQGMQRLATEVAQLQVANIKLRISQGKDVYDRLMPRYTPAYQKRKNKKGRGSTVRNLLLRGHMQRAMLAVPNGFGRVVIKFTDPLQRIKARANQEIAPWFGVSKEDYRKLQRLLQDRLRR